MASSRRCEGEEDGVCGAEAATRPCRTDLARSVRLPPAPALRGMWVPWCWFDEEVVAVEEGRHPNW